MCIAVLNISAYSRKHTTMKDTIVSLIPNQVIEIKLRIKLSINTLWLTASGRRRSDICYLFETR